MADIMGDYMPFKGESWKKLPNVSVKRINEVFGPTGDNSSRMLVPLQLALFNSSYTGWKGKCDGIVTKDFKDAIIANWEGTMGASGGYGKVAIPMTKAHVKAVLEDGNLDPSVVVD